MWRLAEHIRRKVKIGAAPYSVTESPKLPETAADSRMCESVCFGAWGFSKSLSLISAIYNSILFDARGKNRVELMILSICALYRFAREPHGRASRSNPPEYYVGCFDRRPHRYIDSRPLFVAPRRATSASHRARIARYPSARRFSSNEFSGMWVKKMRPISPFHRSVRKACLRRRLRRYGRYGGGRYRNID